MMLPAPSASFTLPSLYDDLELDCRLYFPLIKSESPVQGCAIFAHPYAPLGGNYDDPVVHTVGSLLSKAGFLLVTFNFRGAEKSAGKTSWSAKAELADYVTLYAFILAFINYDDLKSCFSSRDTSADVSNEPLLVLGGYSYGSMIASYLPDVQTVFKLVQETKNDSTEHEIENRAHELAQSFQGWCEIRQHRGRSSLKTAEGLLTSNATFGGYDSPSAAQRVKRDRSRQSIDKERVRRSVDRVRRKLGSKDVSMDGRDAMTDGATDDLHLRVMPRLAYLLISPLMGAVSSLATVFSSLRFERKHKTTDREGSNTSIDARLSTHPSLIVFGTDDHFTSSSKVRAWCESLQKRPNSLVQFQEVAGAGHFWHDQKIENDLKGIVINWLRNMAG